MAVDEHLRILKNILPEQKSKILNRIFFIFAWMLIPFLLLVINTLTWAIHLVANPMEIVIFLYFCLLSFFLWGIILLFKNFRGWKTLHQLEKELFQEQLNFLELNEISSANYFFNADYKMINQQLAFILQNPHFCFQQNQKSLHKQNWDCFWKTGLFLLLTGVFFLSEVLYFQEFNLTQWTIALAFSFLIVAWGLILPWVIFRQVSLNWKYTQYLDEKIDNYQFIFTNRWLFLKTDCEKLEVKDGNFRKSEKFAQ